MNHETPLVFLIHGFMGHPDELAPLAKCLQNVGLATHSVCLPAHGDTPGHLGRFSWQDLVAHCEAELLECRRQYKTVHLVGFCLGGSIGLVLSKRHPEAFQSVSLAATPYKPVFNFDHGHIHARQLFRRVIPGIGRHLKHLNTGFPKPRFYPHDMLRLYPQMQGFFTAVREGALALKTPTLLMQSPFDLTIPYIHGEWLYRAIPGDVNFITLLNTGHQVFPYHTEGLVFDSILGHIRETQAKAQLQACS